MRDPDHHRDEPAQLDQGPGDHQPGGRVVRAAAVDLLLDPAQLGRRAAQPGRARLRLGTTRRGGQHGDQAPLGHLAPGRGHPGVADERVLADLHVLDAQPAAAELVAAEQGVVGEEGAVADARSAWGSAARSRPRPAARRRHRARAARPASASSSRAGTATCAPRRGRAASPTPATRAARARGARPAPGRARAGAPRARSAGRAPARPTTVATGSHTRLRTAAADTEPASLERRCHDGEGGEHRDPGQRGDQHGDRGVPQHPDGPVAGSLGPRSARGLARPGRRPGPELTLGHRAEDRGARGDLRPGADGRHRATACCERRCVRRHRSRRSRRAAGRRRASAPTGRPRARPSSRRPGRGAR